MLELITRIKNESRGGAKALLLKSDERLKVVLEAAYNPFKRYHTSPPDIDGHGDQTLMKGPNFCPEIDFLLTSLNDRTISGNKAIEEVTYMIKSMCHDDAIIFKMILNKDLRAGIGLKTIDSAYPGLIPTTKLGVEKPPIMLCKTFNPKTAKYPLVVAPKKDGVRCRITNGLLLTRSGQPFIGFNHIEKEVSIYDFDIDGEMCVPGMKFDGTSGLIRNYDEVPEAVLYIFDVPSIKRSKAFRYDFMVNNIVETAHLRILKNEQCNNIDDVQKALKRALSAGDEGLVIYTMDHIYRDARSNDWTRLVPLKSEECRVIDFEQGTGKFIDSLGKIIVDFNGVHVKVGTGFAEKLWNDLTPNQRDRALIKYGCNREEYNHRVRDYIWLNREKFVGKYAQLVFKEITKVGSMRQPRFKGWRYDKL